MLHRIFSLEHSPQKSESQVIREHFGEKLRNSSPEAWKEAHGRLYEYYKKSQPKKYLLPLYRAVAHGCKAGRHQEVAEDVYWRRILRGNEYFSLHKLGAFGADLAVVSNFFDTSWDRPAPGLSEDFKAFILNEAGYDLRAFGRLSEGAQPMQAGMESYLAKKEWKFAARVAGNLSELCLTMGDIAQAQEYAKKSVELADKSNDASEQITTRTILADALHQAGSISEAENHFRKSEEMQKKMQPLHPIHYSLRGFHYCDLLLNQRKYKKVLSRAGKTLESVTAVEWFLDIAMDNLSIGRAYLLPVIHKKKYDFTSASEHLTLAVDGLRRSGQQYLLPHGLLSRSELYIVQEDFEKAATILTKP